MLLDQSGSARKRYEQMRQSQQQNQRDPQAQPKLNRGGQNAFQTVDTLNQKRQSTSSFMPPAAPEVPEIPYGAAPTGGSAAMPTTALQRMAYEVAQNYGWTSPGQWQALVELVNRESSWNPAADNPTSTAYGLFQFLDSTWAGTGIRRTSDPMQQIIAGLRYIQSRYGSPAAALAFHDSHNWY
jgi:hypothetical protein